jgi:DNA-binding response OmpR family regulator
MRTKQKRILIVEDTASLRESLQIILRRAGYRAEAVPDGEMGLMCCKKSYPDLVLLDILLPKMSGFDFLKQLRKTPKGKKTPVIVITQFGDQAYYKKATEIGVQGYFIKANISLQQVLDAVHNATHGKSLELVSSMSVVKEKPARVNEGQKVRRKVVKRRKSGTGDPGKHKSKTK